MSFGPERFLGLEKKRAPAPLVGSVDRGSVFLVTRKIVPDISKIIMMT